VVNDERVKEGIISHSWDVVLVGVERRVTESTAEVDRHNSSSIGA